MEEAVIAAGEKEQVPGCNYRHKTSEEFSECETKYTPVSEEQEEQAEILDKY